MIDDPSTRTPRSHPALAVAWLGLGSVLAALTIGWGTIQVVGQLAHEERVEVARVPAAGIRSVDIDTDDGSIEVVATTEPRIRIRARISEGLGPTTYRHEVDGSTLRIRGRCSAVNIGPWCRVSLRIEVPPGLAVSAATDAGRIRVDGLAGVLRLRSDAGPVRGVHLRSATVDARSDAGSVRLQFDRPPASASARSDAGNVEVVVPPDGTAYLVDVRSDAGSTRTEVPTDPNASRRIAAVTDAGSAAVRAAPG